MLKPWARLVLAGEVGLAPAAVGALPRQQELARAQLRLAVGHAAPHGRQRLAPACTRPASWLQQAAGGGCAQRNRVARACLQAAAVSVWVFCKHTRPLGALQLKPQWGDASLCSDRTTHAFHEAHVAEEETSGGAHPNQMA